MLCLGMFFTGTLYAGIFQISFILCSEVINYKYRNLYLSIFFMNISLSAAVFSVLYSLSNTWRYLLLGSSVLILAQVFLMGYVYESTRYLVTNKVDIEAAISVLREISLINGEGDFRYSIISENFNKKASRSIRAICSSKLIAVKICASAAVWLCVLFGFYSFIFFKPTIFDDNFYYNEFTNNLLKIVPFPIVICLIDTLGRKKTLFFATLLIGGIFMIIGVLQLNASDFSRAFADVLVILVSSLMTAEMYLTYVCTSEMYPTYIRCTGMGYCNAIGKLSFFLVIIVGKFNKQDNPSIPSFIFGMVLLISAAISILLEETFEKEMDEVIVTYGQPLLKVN